MATSAPSLQQFIAQYGTLKMRTYFKDTDNEFIGLLCKAEDGTETFLAAPREDGEHAMDGYPYHGSKADVKAFLAANRNDLRVIDGTSTSGNVTHTLCFSQFEDDTEDVF